MVQIHALNSVTFAISVCNTVTDINWDPRSETSLLVTDRSLKVVTNFFVAPRYKADGIKKKNQTLYVLVYFGML